MASAPVSKPAKEEKIALVLSGGGARGAYEAGVLLYLLKDFPKVLGRPVRFDILTGTSVGAINACFLGVYADHEDYNVDQLVEYWATLRLPRVFHFGVDDIVKIPGWALGRVPLKKSALLDARPLTELVSSAVPWSSLPVNIDKGHLEAVTLSATDLATGTSLFFTHRKGGQPLPQGSDPYVVHQPAVIGPQHALASAAIPILFPPVMLDGRLLVDGGVRMNTPLSPALRLGADRMLVVSLRAPSPTFGMSDPFAPVTPNPNLPYLLGKSLSALMLDRLSYDCQRLTRINSMIRHGMEVYGEAFMDKINESIAPMRGVPYRLVKDMILGPSQDIGTLAIDCMKRKGNQMQGMPARMLQTFMGLGTLSESDLMSYLLFDGAYTQELMDLGYKDTQAFREELLMFFNDPVR